MDKFNKALSIGIKTLLTIWFFSLTVLILVPSVLLLFRSWYYSYLRSAYELVVSDTLVALAAAFLGAFTAAVVAKIFGIVANNANVMKHRSEEDLREIRIFPL